jgi:DNA-binding GntR family transcriptional regulator
MQRFLQKRGTPATVAAAESGASRTTRGKPDLRVSPKTVQQEAVKKLRSAIISGFFKPGDRLVELDLCQELGISRPSLREALRSLEAERLIEIIPNRGPIIPVLTWEDAREIYQVRELLEGEAAALCAAAITNDGLTEMSDALEAFREAVDANDAPNRLNATARFYSALLQAAGNKIIHETLQGLLARINFLRDRSMSLEGRAKQSLAEMRAIFAAIKKHDAEGARKAAQKHVAKAREAAQTAFSPESI